MVGNVRTGRRKRGGVSTYPAHYHAYVLFSATLVACMAPIRPTVFPSIDAMPGVATDREEYLETTAARPTAEGTRLVRPKVQTVQTVVATMAALVGAFLTSGNNAAVGFGFSFDENEAFESSELGPKRQSAQQPTKSAEGKPGPSHQRLPLIPLPNPTVNP